MDLSSQEEEDGEMPIPINSTYGHHPHMIHHDPHPAAVTLVVPSHHHGHHHNNNHIIIPPTSSSPQILPPPPSSSGPIILPSPPSPLDHHQEDHVNGPGSAGPNYHNKKMVVVRYRECLKNHAASMGGNATDGCGEFMPSGEEGTIEALTCSACNCHRNFHRKETDHHHHHHQHSSPCDCSSGPLHLNRVGLGGRKLILGHHHQNHHNHHQHQQQHRAIMGPGQAHYPMIMSYNMGSVPSDQSDEQDDGGGGGLVRPSSQQQMMVRKRFRTKFSQEQKEKMFDFAERVGWKIQKQEESVVQQLCQEIGVKRRVLKVWMHNNKHNLAKKNMNINSSTTTPPPPNTQGQL